MHTPTAGEDGAEVDPDLRVLEVMKANRAARGQRLMLRWREDVFRVEDAATASDAMARAHARAVFLDLLYRLARQDRRVSPNTGPTYAPTVLAKEPGGEGITKTALHRAMTELLREGRIVVRTEGRETKRRQHLEIAKDMFDAA